MKRIITGLSAGLGWALLLFFGPFALFWLVMVMLSAAALYEYAGLQRRRSQRDDAHALLLILPGLFPTLAAYSGRVELVAAGLLLALLCLFAVVLLRYSALGNGYDFVARSTFGIIYAGVLPAHLVLLMAQPQGALWLTILTALIVASDSGAYYTGRLFGRRKLCPAISPGKTVEGFVGGLLAGALVAILLVHLLVPGSNLLKFALLALLLCCLGVMGDLIESVLKRSAGVKDSGNILPGHGGILDRADSLLVTAPVFYYLLACGLLTG
jgi:phosphatidate cytidylyltransferase